MMVIERPDAEVIAGAEQVAALAVPDCEGKIADEPRRAGLAPALVGAQDQLGVGDLIPVFTWRADETEQFAPVVDARVRHDPVEPRA